MWLSAPEDAELRQGDLLMGLLLPVPSLPLPLVRAGQEPVGDQAKALIDAKRRNFLVVSQCCTVQNDTFIALAPVRSTKRLQTEEERSAYSWLRPDDVPDGSEARFAFSAMRLDPLPGVLNESDDGRLNVVIFEETQSYKGDRAELVAARSGQMSPEGRLRLRIRLQYFWGRPEAEDARALEEMGLPTL